MTTAARPTFDPAKGGSMLHDTAKGRLSHQVSARDLPSHKTLKARQPGQDTQEELQERDLRAELEEREKIAAIEKNNAPKFKYVPSLEQATQVRLAIKAERDREREAEKEALLNSESVIDEDELGQRFPNIVNARKMAQLDKDEDFGSDNDFSENDFEDYDEDEDDPEELMAELNRIKQERLEEEEKREKEIRNKECRIRSETDDDASSTFSIKRRWDEDVPFKNCARQDSDPKRKLYINDPLRSEFHKKFMNKYIK